MSDAAVPLHAALDRHVRRRRLVRTLEGARRGGRRALVLALAGLVVVMLGIAPPPPAALGTLGAFLLILAGGVAFGAASGWRAAGNRQVVAREVDRAGTLDDLAASATGLLERGRVPGRLDALVLARAAAAVEAVPVEKAGPLPRPPWRLLLAAAFLALLAGLLPHGGLGVLPGFGAGWGSGGRHEEGTVAWGDPEVAGSPDGEETPEEDGEPRTEPDAPPEPDPEEPRSEPDRSPEPVVEDFTVTPAGSTFPPSSTVPVLFGFAGGPSAAGTLDLRLALDDGEAVPAVAGLPVERGGRTTGDVALRRVAGLAERLGPGEHRLRGELRDAAGRVVARAPETTFVIEGPPGEGGGGAPPEPPPPSPGGEGGEGGEEPPPPEAGDGGPPQPPAPVEPPPSALVPRHVLPRIGEGPTAIKKGPVLVLDPEGRRGDAPRVLRPEEVLAEVRSRAEAAMRREGLDPADRDAVQRYFEALRRMLEVR